MFGKLKEHLTTELNSIKEQKLYKYERIIESSQGAEIIVKGKKVLNFCANNYLGLSSHQN
jgi:glycine C-acetyltransferase